MTDSPVLRAVYRAFGGIATVVGLTSSPGNASAEGRPGPPPEAYAACDAKHEGDACSIHIRDMDLQGTCVYFEGKEKLICRPTAPPPMNTPTRGVSHDNE